jgi:hypothetical protein
MPWALQTHSFTGWYQGKDKVVEDNTIESTACTLDRNGKPFIFHYTKGVVRIILNIELRVFSPHQIQAGDCRSLQPGLDEGADNDSIPNMTKGLSLGWRHPTVSNSGRAGIVLERQTGMN